MIKLIKTFNSFIKSKHFSISLNLHFFFWIFFTIKKKKQFLLNFEITRLTVCAIFTLNVEFKRDWSHERESAVNELAEGHISSMPVHFHVREVRFIATIFITSHRPQLEETTKTWPTIVHANSPARRAFFVWQNYNLMKNCVEEALIYITRPKTISVAPHFTALVRISFLCIVI